MSAQDDFVEELRQLAEQLAEQHGLTPSAARIMAASLSEKVRERYACDRPYIKTNRKDSIREKVLADFNGRNHSKVCRKYGIHRATLYRYLRSGGSE